MSQKGKAMKEPLDIEHLGEIQSEFWDARPKWYNFGLHLRLDAVALDVIRKSCDEEDEKFTRVLEQVLKGNGCMPVTRACLLDALESKTVGLRNIALVLRKSYTATTSDSQGGETPPTDDTSESEDTSGYESEKKDSLCTYTNEMSVQCQEQEADLSYAIHDTEIAFIALTNKIRKICMGHKVSVQVIADIVLPCIQHDGTYPLEFEEGIKAEKSIKKLWDNIEKYTAWYRSIPIEKIAVKVAKVSMDDLEKFKTEREWLFKLLKDKYKNQETEVIELKLDKNFETFTDEDLRMVQTTMRNVLKNTSISVLTKKKGCVLISLTVPVVVVVNIFPLSPTMCEEFLQAFPSIISLACGNYRTKFKTVDCSDYEDMLQNEGDQLHTDRGSEEGYCGDGSESNSSTEENQMTTSEPQESFENVRQQPVPYMDLEMPLETGMSRLGSNLNLSHRNKWPKTKKTSEPSQMAGYAKFRTRPIQKLSELQPGAVGLAVGVAVGACAGVLVGGGTGTVAGPIVGGIFGGIVGRIAEGLGVGVPAGAATGLEIANRKKD